MAYKQTPGRGNGMKTGGGISPALMYNSPMKQQKKKDPYSGKTWGELGSEIENFATENKNRIASEMIAKSDSTSAANNAMKLDKTLSKKMAARIGNEAANKTRSEKKIPRVNRGKYTDGWPGMDIPSKYGDAYSRAGQLERDFPTGLLTAYRKASPAKQVSKGAFKKPEMTSTTVKPKASKTPMKQYIDPKAKEREQKRLKDMTPSQRKAEGTGVAGDRGKIKREGPTGPQKGKMDTKSNRKSPAMQMSKLKKKSC
jgi:hypothetical protein